MRTLIPRELVERVATGQRVGELQGAALFVDISGFTAVTEALMARKRAGAEALADAMEAVFAPLIEAVYAQGGFISGFAGDAFTAVFHTTDDAPRRALAAAWTMLYGFAARCPTPFGSFQFGVKMGLAVGEVVWGLAGARTPYVRGPAIDACAAAEHRAASGQLVLTAAARRVLAAHVTAAALDDDFWRVTAVGRPHPATQSLPNSIPAGQAALVPAEILTMTARGEFRQVVTLFVNMQGDPSEAELERVMTAVDRLLAEYDGYLCRLDFGDKGCNLLLFWGAPVAHENDIARTLDFALALRAASPRPLRMGITYRLVYAGFAGSALRAEYTCYGLSVNLAARLMMQAPWGEIWLDEAVMTRAAGFDAAGIGRFAFKGFSDEQAVFRLDGRDAYASAIPFYQGELVGRAAEQARIEEALAGLEHGRFGGALVVQGEAGIGKSRLTHAALGEVADATGARVFLCQTDEILRQPLNPLRYMLRRAFQQHPALSEADNRRRFEAGMQRLLRRTAVPALKDELARTASFLGALLDLFWPDSLYAQLEPDLRFDNTLDALRALFQVHASAQPVIVHIEDAQWLDAETEQFITRLLRSADAVPLALVLTSRAALDPALFGEVDPTVVELGSLAPTAVASLTAHLLNDTPAPELVTLLQTRSEGNPFYVEQLVRYLQEQKLLRGTARGVVAATGDRDLPADIQAVLIARLDRLSREVRDVVQTAAVLGREFEVRVLSEMLRHDRELGLKLEVAEGAAVWSALTELRYIFRHALLQDAAYQMQLESRLAALHRLAANAIEDAHADELSPHYADLVYHCGRGRDNGRERSYARLAAEQAASRFANADAIRYFSRALDLTPDEAIRERFELLSGRCAIFHLTGDREAQLADLRALEGVANQLDAAARAAVLSAYTDFALETADYPGLIRYAERTIAAAQAAGDIGLELRGMTQWANGLYRMGDSDGSLAKLQAALAICDQVRDTVDIRLIESSLHKSLNVTYVRLGQYELARDHILRSIALSESAGDVRTLGNGYNNLALVHYFTGDYEAARAQTLKGLEMAERVGERSSMCLFTSNIGVISYKIGDVETAERYYERALAMQRDIDDAYSQVMTLNNLGVLHMDRGEFERAIERYEASLALAQRAGDRGNEVLATNNLGLVALKIGDWSTAVAYCRAAIDLCREVGDAYHEVESFSNLIWVLCDQGRVTEAVAAAETVLARVPQVEDVQLRGHGTTSAARAFLLAGDYARCGALYRRALADLGESDVQFAEVRAECLAGRVRMALAQGRRPARPDVDGLTELVTADAVHSALRELDVVWACVRGLDALGDGRATAVLTAAHKKLQEQAARFSDETLRGLFLNNIAAHRELVAAFDSLQAG